MQYGRGNKFDAINGNVFNSIGFEDIDCPIKSLYKWSVDRFNYIRMSESIRNSTYIEMDNCTNVLIDLKSYVEASKFKIKDCNTTEIRSMYSVYQYNQKSYDVKKQYSNYQQQNKSFYGIMIIIVRERLINDFKRAFLKFGQKDLPVQMEQLIVVR